LKKWLLIIAFAALFLISANCFQECDWEVCDNNNVVDGYWWRGSWIPGLPTYESQFLELPDLFSGIAVFYGPYVMEGTAEYRGLNLNSYLGGVALPTCSGIGSPVWLKLEGKDWEGPFLVVDCARRNDLYGISIIRKEAVEVDFNTALRWGMVEQYPDFSWGTLKWSEDVIVSRYPPSCIFGEPISLADWLEPRITFADRLETRTNIYEYPSTWRAGGEWITFDNQRTCNQYSNE
jgi:hypothetical protein